MKKSIFVSLFLVFILSIIFFSCSNDIDDMPQNTIVGKWEYDRLVWDSAGGNYKATREAIQNDLHNRWKDIEKGAFTYEFTEDGKYLYNNEYRGQYTFSGSGVIITNLEDGKYVDKGSFQFSFVDDDLYILHNFASEYRDENNYLANIELLKSIGVTTGLDSPQHIYGAWVKLAFKKQN